MDNLTETQREQKKREHDEMVAQMCRMGDVPGCVFHSAERNWHEKWVRINERQAPRR